MTKMDKDTDKRSMDVSKPGKSMPDLSARPVIVTHRPMVQDPMVKSEVKTEEPVVAEETETKADETEDSSPSREKKVIKPISEPVESSETTEVEPKKDESTEEETAAAEAAVVEAVASQAQSRSGIKSGELSEQDKAKQEHINKLIEEKTYFVSTGQASQRRNRRTAAVLFVLTLVIIAGGYAAIDSGVISANIELPIDLIKN